MENSNLRNARKAKNDEFYTQYEDIEKEMEHYKDQFKDKIIYCNCDSKYSNFVKYFKDNYEELGLKGLNYTGIPIDFRSDEAIIKLMDSDIIVTNPPFSLFREFIDIINSYNKEFLIIGNMNAITYKETFKLIKDNKVWLGKTHPKTFIQPNGEPKKFGNICWFTNLECEENDFIELTKNYYKEVYENYDNYDAINIDNVKDIPYDYDKVMGVPITFLTNYNPEQFEIIKFRKGDNEKDLCINGKCMYFRILIKRINK